MFTALERKLIRLALDEAAQPGEMPYRGHRLDEIPLAYLRWALAKRSLKLSEAIRLLLSEGGGRP